MDADRIANLERRFSDAAPVFLAKWDAHPDIHEHAVTDPLLLALSNTYKHIHARPHSDEHKRLHD